MVTLGDTVWYYVNTTYLPASCSLESFQLPLYVGQLSIGGSSWIVGKLRYHMMHHDTTINIHKQHVNAVFWCVLWFSPYHLVECEWWPAAQTYVNKLWWRVQSPEKEVTKTLMGSHYLRVPTSNQTYHWEGWVVSTAAMIVDAFGNGQGRNRAKITRWWA